MKSIPSIAGIIRRIFALALVALGFVSTSGAATGNWRLHTGTTSYMEMQWGEIQREGGLDPVTDTTILDSWTWIWGQEQGLGSGRQQLVVNAHMNGIEADNGAAFRAEMRAKADALIAAMKLKNNGHKVYWQIGNEINSRHFGHGNSNLLGAVDLDGDGVLEEGDIVTGQVDELDNYGTMRDWAVYHGRAYPHPAAPQDGSDGTSDGRNDRGYIPYFVEYFMAPTIQAILAANAAEPNPNFHIKIMTGSIANADTPDAQDTWVPAFLGYSIQGTYCGAGSLLVGKTVKQAVDLLSVHYVMTEQNQLILDAYYDTWVSPFATGTTITGIVATEEIGVAAADNGFGAVLAMKVFSRYADVWLSRGFTPQQGAVCFYGTNNDSTANIPSCKADYAMTKLDEFLPGTSNNFSAYADIVSTDASLALETIGFKNQDDGKRVIFLSPQSTSAHTLSLATMAGSGWTGSNATVTARVFISGGEIVPTAAITKNASTGNYDIALSPAVDLGTSGKVVVLFVTAPTPPPAAPTGLTATAGNAQVALSWSTSSGATSYNVKRSTTSGGPYTTIASPTTPSHTDTTVTNGTTYHYVVSAVNPGGESANSAQASATPQVPQTTVTFNSVATDDGRILETSETGGTGGTTNSTDNTTSSLRAGDDNMDRQFKVIVSFDTSSIPDTATIVSATLKLKRGSLTGTNPFTTHGTCRVDVRSGGFSGNTALEAADFQAAATASNVVPSGMSNPTANGVQSTGAVNSTGLSAINKTGKTQFRVYFSTDDNDDLGNDYMGFYSGEATQANRPVLEIVYQ